MPFECNVIEGFTTCTKDSSFTSVLMVVHFVFIHRYFFYVCSKRDKMIVHSYRVTLNRISNNSLIVSIERENQHNISLFSLFLSHVFLIDADFYNDYSIYLNKNCCIKHLKYYSKVCNYMSSIDVILHV